MLMLDHEDLFCLFSGRKDVGVCVHVKERNSQPVRGEGADVPEISLGCGHEQQGGANSRIGVRPLLRCKFGGIDLQGQEGVLARLWSHGCTEKLTCIYYCPHEHKSIGIGTNVSGFKGATILRRLRVEPLDNMT